MNRPPHVRALYAKTSQKLPRVVANTHLFFVAVHLLTSNNYDLFNYVSFREGSGTANSINGLSDKFMATAKNVVYNYMKMHFKSEIVKIGEIEITNNKFILDVTKEAVLAGFQLFKYMQDVQLAVFDLSGLDNIGSVRSFSNRSRFRFGSVRRKCKPIPTTDTFSIYFLPFISFDSFLFGSVRFGSFKNIDRFGLVWFDSVWEF